MMRPNYPLRTTINNYLKGYPDRKFTIDEIRETINSMESHQYVYRQLEDMVNSGALNKYALGFPQPNKYGLN